MSDDIGIDEDFRCGVCDYCEGDSDGDEYGEQALCAVAQARGLLREMTDSTWCGDDCRKTAHDVLAALSTPAAPAKEHHPDCAFTGALSEFSSCACNGPAAPERGEK